LMPDGYDYKDEAWRDDLHLHEALLDEVRKGDLYKEKPCNYYRSKRLYRYREESQLLRLIRVLWKLLRISLLLIFLLLLVSPSIVTAQQTGDAFTFNYTLLGLSTNINGVYAEKDWMLLVGDNGLVAHALRENDRWIYQILGVGGAVLRDVVWMGDKGLAIGAGRAVLIEGLKGSFTLRDIPFLMDDYVSAAWSLDGSFAVLASSKGALYQYFPGETTSSKLASPRAVLLLQPVATQLSPLPYAVFIGAVGEGEDIRYDAYAVTVDKRVVKLSEIRELRQATEIATNLLNVLPFKKLREPDTALIVLSKPSDNSTVIAWHEGNIVYIRGVDGARSLAIAFPVRKMSGYLEGDRVSLVVVGEGGGVAIIDLLANDVAYVSVPSAAKIIFLDRNTALITSPFGLFIYSYSKVEYFPMATSPSAITHSSHVIVADFSGAIYDFVRPGPWRGGLSLKHITEGGHVIDVIPTKRAPLLVIRRGAQNQLEESSQNLRQLLKQRGVEGLVEATATLGDESMLYLMLDHGLDRLDIAGLEGKKIVDADADPSGSSVLLVGLKGSVLSLTFSEEDVEAMPLQVPKADYLSVAWSPNGCQAVIAGTEGALITYDGRSVARVPAPPTSLRAVSWSSDGAYALIGGDGTLITWGGYKADEAPLKHVVKFLYIAPRPSGREFLASTSLGLMSIEEVSRPRGYVKSDSDIVENDEGLTEVRIDILPVLFSDRIIDYRLESSMPVEVDRIYIPENLNSGCSTKAKITFRVPRVSKVTELAIYLTLKGQKGEYVLSPAKLLIKPREEGLVVLYGWFSENHAFMIIAIVSCVFLIGLRRKLRNRRRSHHHGVKTPERGKPASNDDSRRYGGNDWWDE